MLDGNNSENPPFLFSCKSGAFATPTVCSSKTHTCHVLNFRLGAVCVAKAPLLHLFEKHPQKGNSSRIKNPSGGALWPVRWLYFYKFSLLTGFFNGPSEKLKGALDAGGVAQCRVPWCPREQTKGIFAVAPPPGAGFTARPTKRSDYATVPRLRERSFSPHSIPPGVSGAERFEVCPPQYHCSSLI